MNKKWDVYGMSDNTFYIFSHRQFVKYLVSTGQPYPVDDGCDCGAHLIKQPEPDGSFAVGCIYPWRYWDEQGATV